MVMKFKYESSKLETEWIHKFLWKSEDYEDTGNGIGVQESQLKVPESQV